MHMRTCILAEDHLVYAFFFCSVHMAVRQTICKWTDVVKKLKRNRSVLDSRPGNSSLKPHCAQRALCP